jgi:REP element-mobilizing transposase RayT
MMEKNGKAVLSKLWVHIMVIPKRDLPVLNSSDNVDFDQFIRMSALGISMTVEITSLQKDHIHCLVKLPDDKTLPFVAGWIKSRTTKWLKNRGLVTKSPGWEPGYAAFSVSASVLPQVRTYLRNQFIMHNRKSFDQELNVWVNRYDLYNQY